MKFWKSFLPNLTMALSVAMLIVVYLDRRNPMMGFMRGTPFAVLLCTTCVCAFATAVYLYASSRKNDSRKKKEEEKGREPWETDRS